MLYNGFSKDNYHQGDVQITEDLKIDGDANISGDLKVSGAIDGTLSLSNIDTSNLIAETNAGINVYDENKTNLVANFNTAKIDLFGIDITNTDNITGINDLTANNLISETTEGLKIYDENKINLLADFKTNKIDMFQIEVSNTNNILGVNSLTVNSIAEKTLDAGVSIDNVYIKDNSVDAGTLGFALKLGDVRAGRVDLGKAGVNTEVLGDLYGSNIVADNPGGLTLYDEDKINTLANFDTTDIKLFNSVNISNTSNITGVASLTSDSVQSDVYNPKTATNLQIANSLATSVDIGYATCPTRILDVLQANTINERTSSVGVNIDGVLIRDSEVRPASCLVGLHATNNDTLCVWKNGVTNIQCWSTGSSIIYTPLYVDTINENTVSNGVLVDGLRIKDSSISVGSYMTSTNAVKISTANSENYIFASVLQTLPSGSRGIGLFHAVGENCLYFNKCTDSGGSAGNNIMKICHNGDASLIQTGATFNVDNIVTESIENKIGSASLDIGRVNAGIVRIGAGSIPVQMEGLVRAYDIDSQSTGDQNLYIAGNDATGLYLGRTGITTQINGTVSIPNVLNVAGDFQYTSGRMEAYFDGSANVSIPQINQYYPVVLPSITVNHQAGFSMDITTTIGAFTYTGSRSRYVHCGCIFSTGMATGTNQQLSFGIHDVTGAPVLVPGSEVDVFIGNNASDRANGAIHFFPLMAPNNRYRLYVKNTAVNNCIIYHINMFCAANPGLA